jgi:hypothetical protein
MDTIALDSRLRFATGFLGRNAKMLIDGKMVSAASGKTFPVYNPATGTVIANVPEGDKADVDLAVAAARRAFDDGRWSSVSPSQRGKLLWRLADLIERDLEELAELESIDNGKPYAVARVADLPLAVDMFRYMAGWATKITGSTLSLSAPGEYLSYTMREPVGVVGQIIPWNFPLLMACWKIAPALAVGCTVVLKAAEQTPMTALRLAELVQEAGFPPGVVNILTGFGETAGAALAVHPDVDKIAFTGSTEVGKLIVQAAAGNLKKVSLELGGKSPAIILADADIDAAIAGAASAIFFNHGQCCCAGSRLYAHKSIYDKVVAGVADIASKIKVGPGLDPATRWDLWFPTNNSHASRASSKTAAARGRQSPLAETALVIWAISSRQPYLKTPRRTCALSARKSLAPWCARRPSMTTIWSGSPNRPTIRFMASRRACGHATAARHTNSPAVFVPERCGSIATTCSMHRCRSAVTSNQAGAARWARKCFTTTPKSRPSPPRCNQVRSGRDTPFAPAGPDPMFSATLSR